MAVLPSSPSASSHAFPTEISADIEAFAKAIRVPIQLILVLTIFASMLVPILITLLWFSTPSFRRQPVFIVNVASIIVGIGVAMLGIYDGLSPVLNPTSPVSDAAGSAFICALLLAPWLAELVLAFRLASLFPSSHTPRLTFAIILAFPVIVKCARLGCCIALSIDWVRKRIMSLDIVLAEAEGPGWRDGLPWYLCAELLLQILDNSYLSTVFIWKLHRGHIFHRRGAERAAVSSRSSLTSRLKTLFWIAIGNFIFPILFNIATIVDVFVDPQYVLRIPNLLLANYYLSIIGVVFATVWCTSSGYSSREPPLLALQLSDSSKIESASSSPSSAATIVPSISCYYAI
ncbi:hypothetical protein PsYK624_138910 [Phanerochaete sordida]|uniref:Uncharacterized protein n=1 Tax=Phanerochaete sordida TaxID=48140 RepID=A0A9P3GLS2_9APHY|nr:hypothetical protein PsYK624_138910 [Phanerochaete sordida]